jgi:hypothetical protein
MDTMGALALATEEPNKELLDDQPHGRWAAGLAGRAVVKGRGSLGPPGSGPGAGQ